MAAPDLVENVILRGNAAPNQPRIPIATDVSTLAPSAVTVEGQIPATGDTSKPRRIMVRWTTDPTFTTYSQAQSAYVPAGVGRGAGVAMLPLVHSTRYYVRVWTQDNAGVLSSSFESGDFWTDRQPNAPQPAQPANNQEFSGVANVRFSWLFTDPDDNDYQTGAAIYYRPVGGVFSLLALIGADGFYVLPGGTLAPETFYEWQVYVTDAAGFLSPGSAIRTFYYGSVTLAPLILQPTFNEVWVASEENILQFKFRDPDPDVMLQAAGIRFRQAGTVPWNYSLLIPSPVVDTPFFPIPEDTFVAGLRYEIQVITVNSNGENSPYSASQFFWASVTPGSGGGSVPTLTEPQGMLGCGEYRVYVYDRGGQNRRGEIDEIMTLQWGRKRDDISNCLIRTNGYGKDRGVFLDSLHTWQYELVVERNGERVWEGPIMRINDRGDGYEIEAKDVMQYVYRRIMRQGYNDSYQLVDGVQLGLHTVVYRARQIILNAMGYDDPNILQYLTTVEFDDDTRQSRVIPSFSKTAWGEVDDLAATAGLDYTTVGRRIILWDTHRSIGTLSPMGAGDFSDPPEVTEYGSTLATDYAVTNNAGVYGIVSIPEGHDYYGHIEMLSSAYGEAAGAATGQVLTPEAEAELVETLTEQASRNISGRYPAPVIVRVSDNTTVSPDANVGINQLVPGAWVPLRAVGRRRKITQIQRIDSITVNYADSKETVKVTFSPAPIDDVEVVEGEL